MLKTLWYRRTGCVAVFLILLTGSPLAMATPLGDASDYRQPPALTKEVPLHFGGHNFDAYCYNTQRCSVIYNNYEFTSFYNDKSAGPFKPADKENWSASYADIRNFPPPAEVKWTAKDGTSHEAKVDIGSIFKDGLIWHNVPKADMKDFYSGPYAGNPDILIVVDDHAVSVYTGMFIPTKTLQRPGHPNSNYRDDWFLAWSHTY